MYALHIFKEPITLQDSYRHILDGTKIIHYREYKNSLYEYERMQSDTRFIWYTIQLLKVDDFPCDCEDDIEIVQAKEQILNPLW